MMDDSRAQRKRQRSRSYSPNRQYKRSNRSRSPGSKHSKSRSSQKHDRHSERTRPDPTLPFKASALDKRDMKAYRPLFAMYLDAQKGLILDDLDKHESKGRWKSFIGKWNRGELAEGWYDPSVLQRARNYDVEESKDFRRPDRKGQPRRSEAEADPSDDDDDGELGPQPPGANAHSRQGPTIPTRDDLELRKELDREEAQAERGDLRFERRQQRRIDKDRLDELAPRAEPGTRERQLEKKRENASANRTFAAAKEGGEMAEVADSDLMGGDDGIDSYKRQKQEVERKKNEREIAREEIMRARREEREARQREFREREERTMKGLIELAKKRFG